MEAMTTTMMSAQVPAESRPVRAARVIAGGIARVIVHGVADGIGRAGCAIAIALLVPATVLAADPPVSKARLEAFEASRAEWNDLSESEQKARLAKAAEEQARLRRDWTSLSPKEKDKRRDQARRDIKKMSGAERAERREGMSPQNRENFDRLMAQKPPS
jgi:hypothetical protein